MGTNGNLHRRWAAAGAVIAIVKLVVGVLVIALFENSWPVCVLILLRALPGPGLALHFSVRLLAGGVIKESLSMSEEN